MKTAYMSTIAALFLAVLTSVYFIALTVIENRLLAIVENYGSVTEFNLNYDLSAQLIGFAGKNESLGNYQLSQADVSAMVSLRGIRFLVEIRDASLGTVVIPKAEMRIHSENFAFSELPFTVSTSSPISSSKHGIKQIELAGTFYPDDLRFKFLNVDFYDYEYSSPQAIFITHAKSELDFLEVKHGVLNLSGKYYIQGASASNLVDKFNASGMIRQEAGLYIIEMSADEITSEDRETKLRGVEISANSASFKIEDWKSLNLEIARVENSESFISGISSRMNKLGYDEINMQGNFSSANVAANNMQIAAFPSTNFAANIRAPSAENSVAARVEMETLSEPILSAELDAVINCREPFDQDYVKIHCNNLAIEILGDASCGEQCIEFKGSCKLGIMRCRPGSEFLEIATTDTNAAYAALQATKIINPVALGLVFMNLLGGERVGMGHRIIISQIANPVD